MTRKTIQDASDFYSQEIIDVAKNILIRTYHLEGGFGFRFVSFKEGYLYDPIECTSNFNWVYGPLKRLDDVRDRAFDLYTLVNQK